MPRILLSLLVLLLMQGQSYSQSYSRIRVEIQNDREFEVLARTGVPVDHIIYRKGAYAELEASPADLERIRLSGLPFEVLIEDVSKFYVERNSSPQFKTAAAGCDNQAPEIEIPQNFSLGSMGGFFTYQEMLDNLDSMAAKYPGLITVRQPVGSFVTHENRPIYWAKISDNASANEPEPQVFYNALHHAREAASLSQLIFYMWYLLENYSSDPEVASLLDNLELYFVPCINPDGYIYNETTNSNGGGMWRKNRRNNGDGTFGVDLNRNYGHAWGFDNTGSSPNTSSDTYRGPAAFSEPETQAIKYFCENHQFKLTLNYHTYGDLLIYPWGYQPSIYTPDSAIFVNYAQLLTRDNHYHYGTGDQTVGYVTNGDSDDWMYGEQSTKGKIYSMTPEAGLSSDGFWPAISRITDICQVNVTQNINMARLALKYATLKENSKSNFTQLNGFIKFDVTRLGLDSPATFTVSISPLQNVLSVGSSKSFSGMTLLEIRTDSINFTLPSTLNNGDAFSFLMELNNGLWSEFDTIVKYYGSGNVTYAHNGNQLTGFTSNTWNTTSSVFYSASSSITDSPGGNYPNNTNRTVTMNNPIDLTGVSKATLKFFARWDIEEAYDYVQVEASANGGAWQPLCGKYTTSGSSDQEQGEPLYDGTQLSWVEEEMSLQDFIGSNQVLIRFRLKSDVWVTEDGFYFDDLSIETIDSPSSIQEVDGTALRLMPNPASDYFYLEGAEPGTKLTLFDGLGRTIKDFYIHSSNQKILLHDISPGVYIIAGGNRVGRLVVVGN